MDSFEEALVSALLSQDGKVILNAMDKWIEFKAKKLSSMRVESEEEMWKLASLQNQLKGVRELLVYLRSLPDQKAARSVRSVKSQSGGGVTARRK